MTTLKKLAMFAAVAALGTAGMAQAADTIWNNGTTNQLWSDAGNWSNGVPTTGKRAVFNRGITETVICSGSVAPELLVTSSTTLLIDSGGDLEITVSATIDDGSKIDVYGLFQPAALVNEGMAFVENGAQMIFVDGADVTGTAGEIHNEGQVIFSGSGGDTDISAGQLLSDVALAAWEFNFSGGTNRSVTINRSYTGTDKLNGDMFFMSTVSRLQLGTYDVETLGDTTLVSGTICTYTPGASGSSYDSNGSTNDCSHP